MERHICPFAAALLVTSLALCVAPAFGAAGETEIQKLYAREEEQRSDIATLENYTRQLRLLTQDLARTRPKLTSAPATQPVKKADAHQKMNFAELQILRFDNRPLAECLDAFKKSADVELVVDWETVRRVGVEPTTPISTRAASLRRLLEAANPTKPLNYYIDEAEIVHITTDDAIATTYVTRTYNVADLLLPAGHTAAELIPTIKKNAGKGNWKDDGKGGGGTISVVREQLTVTQTLLAHEQLYWLLDQLRSGAPDRAFRDARDRLARGDAHLAALRAEVNDLIARCRTAHIMVPREPTPPYKVIGKPLPKVIFNKRPLREAVDALAELASVTIHVNFRGLELAGISGTTPVTLEARNAPLADVLDRMMQSASASPDAKGHANYAVEDDSITITSELDLMQSPLTLTYDARDLLPAKGNREEAVNALMASLRKDVFPDSWLENGGLGKMQQLQGVLIVTQGSHVHRAIKAYLDAKRQPVKDPRTRSC